MLPLSISRVNLIQYPVRVYATHAVLYINVCIISINISAPAHCSWTNITQFGCPNPSSKTCNKQRTYIGKRCCFLLDSDLSATRRRPITVPSTYIHISIFYRYADVTSCIIFRMLPSRTSKPTNTQHTHTFTLTYPRLRSHSRIQFSLTLMICMSPMCAVRYM